MRILGTGGSTTITNNIIGLPKTGQTSSYATGSTGDDGFYEKGSTLTRFTDNGNGTITDNVLGLMWIKQPERSIFGTPVPDYPSNTFNRYMDGSSPDNWWATGKVYQKGDFIDYNDGSACYVALTNHTAGATRAADVTAGNLRALSGPGHELDFIATGLTTFTSKKFTWQNCITNCEGLVFAGYSDWRLPNIFEMSTLMNFEGANCIPSTTFFPNISAAEYWTSTTTNSTSPGTTQAKYINFQYGLTSHAVKGSNSYLCLPVRSI